MAFRRKFPEDAVVVKTSRGTLAEQLEVLRASREAKLAAVVARQHAAAAEAARLMDESFLARQRLADVEREVHGIQHGLDFEEHRIERQLEESASPLIDEFLAMAGEAFDRRRNGSDPRLTPRELEAFVTIRRAVAALRVQEVPDLEARLAEYARELAIPWAPWITPRSGVH